MIFAAGMAPCNVFGCLRTRDLQPRDFRLGDKLCAFHRQRNFDSLLRRMQEPLHVLSGDGRAVRGHLLLKNH